MTNFEDPPRFADSPTAPPRLGSMFRAARSDVPTEAQLSALASKLGPSLSLAHSAGLPVLAKLGASAVVVALGIGGLIYARSASPVSARDSARSPAQPVASASPSNAAIAVASATSTPPEVEEQPAATPAVSARPHLAPAPPAAAPVDEATLLESARAALATNPARALALASTHAQAFPQGVLAQEREVIAIAALRRLGRTADAERRAGAFDRYYPHSAHQRTVDVAPTR